MSYKMIGKILTDLVMTILLLLLMARQITGDSAHEWLGAAMFVLWVIHHIFNFKWYAHLLPVRTAPLKKQYPAGRILRIIINFLLLLSMLGTMISGVILSREVFAFLPISGGIALARPMHVLCAFWGFVLMAVHLGLHWSMILAMFRRIRGPVSSKPLKILLPVAGGAVAVYGLYAFIKNRFLSYMFLTSSFVFFDFERPLFLFFTEYIGIMGLFVFAAYYGSRILGRKKQ